MRTRLRILAALVSAASSIGIGIVVVPAAANAVTPMNGRGVASASTNKPGDDEKPTTFRFRSASTDVSTQSSTDVYCTTVPSPRPQLSHTQSGYTVHWGAKMNCTIVGTLRLSVYVVQWDNGYMYVQDSADAGPTVGWELWGGGITWCDYGISTKWQVRFVPTFNGIPGEPLEGYSSIVTLNCN